MFIEGRVCCLRRQNFLYLVGFAFIWSNFNLDVSFLQIRYFYFSTPFNMPYNRLETQKRLHLLIDWISNRNSEIKFKIKNYCPERLK